MQTLYSYGNHDVWPLILSYVAVLICGVAFYKSVRRDLILKPQAPTDPAQASDVGGHVPEAGFATKVARHAFLEPDVPFGLPTTVQFTHVPEESALIFQDQLATTPEVLLISRDLDSCGIDFRPRRRVGPSKALDALRGLSILSSGPAGIDGESVFACSSGVDSSAFGRVWFISPGKPPESFGPLETRDGDLVFWHGTCCLSVTSEGGVAFASGSSVWTACRKDLDAHSLGAPRFCGEAKMTQGVTCETAERFLLWASKATDVGISQWRVAVFDRGVMDLAGSMWLDLSCTPDEYRDDESQILGRVPWEEFGVWILTPSSMEPDGHRSYLIRAGRPGPPQVSEGHRLPREFGCTFRLACFDPCVGGVFALWEREGPGCSRQFVVVRYLASPSGFKRERTVVEFSSMRPYSGLRVFAQRSLDGPSDLLIEDLWDGALKFVRGLDGSVSYFPGHPESREFQKRQAVLRDPKSGGLVARTFGPQGRVYEARQNRYEILSVPVQLEVQPQLQ